jgi:hypothetical protein
MTLKSELELGLVFSVDTFIIKFEKLFTNSSRVNVVKTHWENHLSVSLQFLQHIRVAIFQHGKSLLNTLKNLIFRLTGVNPFGKSIKKLLFKLLTVFFSTQITVDRHYAF